MTSTIAKMANLWWKAAERQREDDPDGIDPMWQRGGHWAYVLDALEAERRFMRMPPTSTVDEVLAARKVEGAHDDLTEEQRTELERRWSLVLLQEEVYRGGEEHS